MRNIINTDKANDKMPETIVSPTPKASSVWLGHCSYEYLPIYKDYNENTNAVILSSSIENYGPFLED